MKRSTKSFTKASKLYQSIHQQLSVYAGAVVVVVVSILALTQPSEAKIVYTHADVRLLCHIFCSPPYNLDLNHDGVTDFMFTVSNDFRLGFCNGRAESDEFPTVIGNGVVGTPLNEGAQIGHGQSFVGGEEVMAWYEVSMDHCAKRYGGPWYYVNDRYLGVEFQKNGKTHYGWARLSVSPSFIYLTGYAYETIAGKSIKAGQKKEAADDPTDEDFGSGASLTVPLPDKYATCGARHAGSPCSGRPAMAAEGVGTRRSLEASNQPCH